jgi:hypothetical protein
MGNRSGILSEIFFRRPPAEFRRERRNFAGYVWKFRHDLH